MDIIYNKTKHGKNYSISTHNINIVPNDIKNLLVV